LLDSVDSSGVFRQLTLEQNTKQLVSFPLLSNAASYHVDEINLSEDAEVGESRYPVVQTIAHSKAGQGVLVRLFQERNSKGDQIYAACNAEIQEAVKRAQESDVQVDTAAQRAQV